MRRLVASLAAALCACGLLVVVQSATAVTAPTVVGMPTVGRGQTVTLTGTTSTPGATVLVYFHKKNTTGYTPRRQLKSDEHGGFRTSFVADTDYRYYVVSGGVSSATGLTQVVSASCTVSGPVISRLPFMSLYPLSPDPYWDFASFQAANDAGLWAGYALLGPTFKLITWSSKTHRLTVLGTFDYGAHARNMGEQAAVQAVAVTRGGSVIANLQRTDSDGTTIAVVYMGGRRYTLSHAADWKFTRVVGISDAGVIVGEVTTPHGTYVVSWANATAPYHVVARGAYDPAVDGAGDIAYRTSDDPTRVQLAQGQVGYLDDGVIPIGGTGGAQFIGQKYDVGIGRWNVQNGAGARAPMTALLASAAYVLAVGRNGSFVIYSWSTHLSSVMTARGVLVQIPHTNLQGTFYGGATAIAPNGTIAFTSNQDGLPRFMTCR